MISRWFILPVSFSFTKHSNFLSCVSGGNASPSSSGCREHLLTDVADVWRNNSGKWKSKQPRVARVLEEIMQVAGCGALASMPSWLESRGGVLLLSPAPGAPHSTPGVRLR